MKISNRRSTVVSTPRWLDRQLRFEPTLKVVHRHPRQAREAILAQCVNTLVPRQQAVAPEAPREAPKTRQMIRVRRTRTPRIRARRRPLTWR